MAQNEVSASTGVFTVTFGGEAKAKPADVQKTIGTYKLEKLQATLIRKVEDKSGVYLAGDVMLANPRKKAGDKGEDHLDRVAGFLRAKKEMLKLTGVLTDDGKGKATLELSGVADAETEK